MIKWTDTEATRATGRVTARTGRSHTVATDDGRTLIADSATPYNQGARVTVVAGAIIGPAGAAPVIKNYQQ
jgi:hypothetical protein